MPRERAWEISVGIGRFASSRFSSSSLRKKENSKLLRRRRRRRTLYYDPCVWPLNAPPLYPWATFYKIKRWYSRNSHELFSPHPLCLRCNTHCRYNCELNNIFVQEENYVYCRVAAILFSHSPGGRKDLAPTYLFYIHPILKECLGTFWIRMKNRP